MSSNSFAVDSYLTCAREKVQDYKIVSKLNKLINDSDSLLPEARAKTFNKLDDQLNQIFISTEKQCRKIRSRKVDFSPELSRLGLT